MNDLQKSCGSRFLNSLGTWPVLVSLGGGKPARVPDTEREVDSLVDVPEDTPVPLGRRRAARLPVVVPGLGEGNDRPSARGHRSHARPCGPEQGRSGVRTVGLVRAAAALDGRLGAVSGRWPPAGKHALALTIAQGILTGENDASGDGEPVLPSGPSLVGP